MIMKKTNENRRTNERKETVHVNFDNEENMQTYSFSSERKKIGQLNIH